MEVQWHSNSSVNVTYRKPVFTWLVRRTAICVNLISICVLAGSMISLLVGETTWRRRRGILSEFGIGGSGNGKAVVEENVLRMWVAILLSWMWWLFTWTQIPMVTRETLTVTRGLGIQVSRYFEDRKIFVKFVPSEELDECCVVESFQNLRIISTLNFLLKDRTKDTIVPFKHTLPREEDLWVMLELIDDLLFDGRYAGNRQTTDRDPKLTHFIGDPEDDDESRELLLVRPPTSSPPSPPDAERNPYRETQVANRRMFKLDS
ncbi:GPI-GlcNAc transferase complex, PIG-H component [Gregarina niphandrodes]|uniref:GPI-GlcNAc transferase complex, PIG-H component n=1 Tax=Gregarina niphandrodes TaxID=110365 RepID=A0A023B456_GRENI|nr:GPI-GlcNAc transferase complex, PIG-H component [Gregarina niphandrodes]EZG56475.1 GPI-GlcNAc transferase complex, PIG-H component [Gregarina niphandrodes]|eukprot:XP_011131250.1 GPI-GlcNAc transferase complex, PIG-H component [Gregarina niphandrodes]